MILRDFEATCNVTVYKVFDPFSLRQLVLGNIRSASTRSQNTLCYFSILIHVNGDE